MAAIRAALASRTSLPTSPVTLRSFSTSRILANMKPVQLYTAPTPNGQKVSIMLEEIKALNPSFEYETRNIDIMKNEQKEDWFLNMNPNGRIPTILDPNNTATDDKGFPVMESMAIMLYLEVSTSADDDRRMMPPNTCVY